MGKLRERRGGGLRLFTWEAAELTSELELLSQLPFLLYTLHLLHPKEGGMLGGRGKEGDKKKTLANSGHMSSGLCRLLD